LSERKDRYKFIKSANNDKNRENYLNKLDIDA